MLRSPAAAALAVLDGLRQDIDAGEQQCFRQRQRRARCLRYGPTILEMKRSLWEYRYRLHREQKTPEAGAEVRSKTGGTLGIGADADRQDQRTPGGDGVMPIRWRWKAAGHRGCGNRSPLVQKRLATWPPARGPVARDLSAFFVGRGPAENLNGELGGRMTVASLARRWRRRPSRGGGHGCRLFWNYRLFVAEDTIEVDGKKVTGYSSITIGKVSRALIIFTAGVLLTLWLARLGETIVVHRFRYDAARARIPQVVLRSSLLVLLVVVLTWVNVR